MRTIAIDWSGAKSGERSKIWLAEVRSGSMVRLENGRSRTEVIEHVIEEAGRDPDLVVGLDFAFSLPAWFLAQRSLSRIEDLWAQVDRHGETWLRDCEPPFWGRPGRRKPDLDGHFRVTERTATIGGISAKSVFQIGGAGAVGTGSIRGMPYLGALRSAGFSVWPFHAARLPLAIEIYPRLLTGSVRKSSQEDRERYLSSGYPEISNEQLHQAASSEDAFDAAVSAVIMARHEDEVRSLRQATDPTTLLEGRIWWPDEAASPARAGPSPNADAPRATVAGCPFCEPTPEQIVAETRGVFAVRDRYPVGPGHTLVIPRAHDASLFARPSAVQEQVWRLVARVRRDLEAELRPDGFTIGVNDGEAAGQTVPHAHVHVIPRFSGDVPDPRGGVRWVRPEQAPYWER